jgi:predicted  nucleic acid-binding Zn-ribbon protein
MTLSRLIDELHRLIDTTSPHAETHVSAVWRESFMKVRIDHDIKSSEAEQMQEQIDSQQGDISELNDRVADLRDDLSKAKYNEQGARERAEYLERKLAEVEERASWVAGLEKQIGALIKQVAEANDRADRYQKRIADCETQDLSVLHYRLTEEVEKVERLTQSVKISDFTIESQKLIITDLTQKLNGK